MPLLDVNTEKSIKLSAKLDSLTRSAFPSAVRNTLNTAAFEMKKEIPVTASKKFITRQKSFFRRFSTVDKASGFNVNTMKSTVGINGSLDREVSDNLVSQEYGGLVRGKKLIPHDLARISNSQQKRVRKVNRLNKVHIHKSTRAFKRHKGSKSSKFVAAVMSTAKAGKSHMLLKNGNRGMVYEVKNVRSSVRSGKLSFKAKKLYTFRKNKTHNVSSTGFMMSSALKTSKKLDDIYKKQAEYQFNKYLKK